MERTGLTLQRDFIRIKNRTQWLLLEMKQPTLTLIKNFSAPINSDYGDMMDDVECSPRKFSEDQKVQWRLKTKILEDWASHNLENWELKALNILKIDHSSLAL